MRRATGDGDFAQHVVCVGPAAIPSHESPEVAVSLLVERGYDACEIDFGGGFWMDWDYAECLGLLARAAGTPAACGAAPVVIHPGFLLGREREQAIDAVVRQLDELHERLA